MRAGPLRQQLLIERKVVIRSPSGAEIITWQPVATVWAALHPFKADERVRGGQAIADVSHKIQFRYRDDLGPAMRLRHPDGRIFDPSQVIDVDERHREIEVMAVEVTTE